jgi:hypothetical protein
MSSLTQHLTPKRRFVVAWSLIGMALLCQVTPQFLLLNLFAIFAAAAFHEIMIDRPRPKWEPKLVRVICLSLSAVFFVLVFFRLVPLEKILYVLYVLVGVFLIWGLVTDIRWLRTTRRRVEGTGAEQGTEDRDLSG